MPVTQKCCPVCRRRWSAAFGQHPDDARISPRQLEILRYIVAYQDARQCSSSYDEIAKHLGVNKTTIFEHVSILVARNIISTSRNKARSIVVNQPERFRN